MEDAVELDALSEIATEVDEAQKKMIAITQCIKAQGFLASKLKKQAKLKNEKCVSLYNANQSLQSEITHDEQEIKSKLTAMDTIQMANVELKREWLVAKERNIEIRERVENGEKKYEDLWLEAKNRYESIPYVQKLLQATAKTQNYKNQISAVEKQAETLAEEIEAQKEACESQDRKLIHELAEFMVHDRPRMVDEINKIANGITGLTNELKRLQMNSVAKTKDLEERRAVRKPIASVTAEEYNKNDDERIVIMPKLKLDSLDFDDSISAELDQAKIKKEDNSARAEMKESFNKSYFDYSTKTNIEDNSYYSKYKVLSDDSKMQNYSKMKLITILEDVDIDANDAQNMISKVNPNKLLPVDTISAEHKPKDGSGVPQTQVKENEPKENERQENEDMDSIEIISSNAENLVMPPSQFLDGTLKTQNSQEPKTVSFAVAITSQNDVMSFSTDKNDAVMEHKDYQPINSQLDESAVSDYGYNKIKDLVLKKHNLDLSPDFVYTKNTMQPTVSKTHEKIITSKFFNKENLKDVNECTTNDKTGEKQYVEGDKPQVDYSETKETIEKSKVIEMDEDNLGVSSHNKKQKIEEITKSEKPISGFVFTHGTHGILESLNESLSNCFEDGDNDYPQCTDSSLLLSPKADFPMNSENAEDPSQEAPNFLSGLRKSGLSFFGRLTSKDLEAESSGQNQGSSGFNFNFSGGDEKKKRGGLFNMFQ